MRSAVGWAPRAHAFGGVERTAEFAVLVRPRGHGVPTLRFAEGVAGIPHPIDGIHARFHVPVKR